MQADNNYVLKIEGVSKHFGGIRALNDVHFELKQGEVHALLGENGAGKSTLMNIVSGIFKADDGTIILNGETVSFKSPLAAKQHGIVKVHQELQLIPEMTVAQNMFLGNEPISKLGKVNFNQMEKQADAMLKKMEADFSASTITRRLSTAQMQMVEIAKALLNEFTVLILDEPTASLTIRETEQLFKTIRSLKAQGKSIIYISHRLDEIFKVCDRATVFRDGRYVATKPVSELSKDMLIRLMTERDISDKRFNVTTDQTDEVVLEVQGFSDGKRFSGIDFTLHKGEILGFYGLVGAGRTELLRAVFGADRQTNGEIRIRGREAVLKSPRDAIGSGLMLIPEDRKLQGFVSVLNNYENVSLSNLKSYARFGWLSYKKRNRMVDGITKKLNIHPDDNTMQTSRLSGGNQQKVVVAKAINTTPDILILDEPTRGIDVNAKNEIYLLIKQLAAQGKSIIMISSEMPEILSLSDRIIVMYEGRITGRLTGRDATEQGVMHYAIGGN